ncbi:hypothetical protein EGW08_001060, partial [Elysia chlorotica]
SREGQCGTGCLDILPSPSLVPIEINTGFCEHGIPNPATIVGVKSVACGASHTLALSYESEIWAWGAGPQLGLGELVHAPIPRRIDSLSGKVALAVYCGNSHSLALIQSSSRSSVTPNSSPVKNKKMVAAKSIKVKEDMHYPPRCTVCNSEIYTFTECNDTCVIEAVHECKSAHDTNPSSTDDVFTSFTEKKNLDQSDKAGNSPDISNYEEPCSQKATGDQETGDSDTAYASLQEKLGPDCVVSPKKEEGLLDDSRLASIPDCEASILVIDGEHLLEGLGGGKEKEEDLGDCEGEGGGGGGTQREEEDGQSVEKVKGEEENLGNSCGDGEKVEDVENNNKERVSREEEDGENIHKADDSVRNTEDVNDGCSSACVKEDLRMPESVDAQDEKEQQPAPTTNAPLPTAATEVSNDGKDTLDQTSSLPTPRQRSASSASVKSLNMLNQSSAMEYLQRQFEDEVTAEESAKDEKVASAEGKKEKRNLSLDNVLGYSSNVMSQVKSMTSRAWTNLSMFGSSGQLAEGLADTTQADPGGQDQGQGDRTPQSQSLLSSGGSSALSSPAYRDSPDSDTNSSSLARWSHDLAAVNPDPGSAESAGQKSLRTIQMQQRNLSSSRTSTGTSVTEEPRECQPPVVTATEVWTWGKNNQCQLGLGDQLDRASPTELKGFRGRHVVKLAAGLGHSLALASNS